MRLVFRIIAEKDRDKERGRGERERERGGRIVSLKMTRSVGNGSNEESIFCVIRLC